MGEFELLAKVRERLSAPGGRVLVGPGDDAAVTVPAGATATSVDALVEGVHFRRDRAALGQIGAKALAAALSDLAAMGAEAGEAYTVLGVPEDLDESGCLELVEGILGVATATETTLAGGDVTRSPTLFISITVVGHTSAPGQLVTRAGARPGDTLVLTGELGAAAAGLWLAEHRAAPGALSETTAAALASRQHEPTPRLKAGRALAAAGANAMIDLSDGLGGDARHLAEASGVGLLIDAAALPLAAGVAEVAALAAADPLQFAVSGGEDYELLAAVPAGLDLEVLAESAGTAIARVGEVVAGSGVEIRLPGGRTLEPIGFDQLG